MILFLGSGISLPSGLPSVSRIREELRRIRDPRVQKLFDLLIDLDSQYLERSAPFKNPSGCYRFTGQIYRSETTYEDLYYLVDQIAVNGEGLKADLTVEALVTLIVARGRDFLNGATAVERTVDLHVLANTARTLIREHVSKMLQTTRITGLDLVVELAESALIDNLSIVTLNHDTLVEQLLSGNGIRYSDGFGETDGDVRWYEDSYHDDACPRLIKLHGSVSWRSQRADRIAQPVTITDQSPSTWHNAQGELLRDIARVPSFLTGVSKFMSYNRGIFADQHYRFLQQLHANHLMVMSGYGWGDIPINFHLQNWLSRCADNKLVLLHQDPDSLVDRSLELRHIYSAYTSSGRIVPIAKWLASTCVADLAEHL